MLFLLELNHEFHIDEAAGEVGRDRTLEVVDVGDPHVGRHIVDTQYVEYLHVDAGVADRAQESRFVFHAVATLL